MHRSWPWPASLAEVHAGDARYRSSCSVVLAAVVDPSATAPMRGPSPRRARAIEGGPATTGSGSLVLGDWPLASSTSTAVSASTWRTTSSHRRRRRVRGPGGLATVARRRRPHPPRRRVRPGLAVRTTRLGGRPHTMQLAGNDGDDRITGGNGATRPLRRRRRPRSPRRPRRRRPDTVDCGGRRSTGRPSTATRGLVTGCAQVAS